MGRSLTLLSKFGQEFECSVGGSVIDNHDFLVDVYRLHADKNLLNRGTLVVDWDHYRYMNRLPRRHLVILVEARCPGCNELQKAAAFDTTAASPPSFWVAEL